MAGKVRRRIACRTGLDGPSCPVPALVPARNSISSETADGSHGSRDVRPRVLVVNADPLQLTEQVLAIAEGAFPVVGVDSSPAMIDVCRKRFPTQEWLVGDMRKLGLRRTFSGIAMNIGGRTR